MQDVSIDKLDLAALARARLVAISVPMHTALRLGTRVAAQAPEGAHVSFFGLYAALNAAHLREKHGDSIVLDEGRLVELAQALERGDPAPGNLALPSRAMPLPSRGALPVLERYAQLETAQGLRLVASVEASRGCRHLCRHCPIVPVWQGRFVAIDRALVLADIAQQVERGASHVSFGDPDFLNGPTHALKIARELHERFPEVTFDATIKVEHLLQHRALLPGLAKAGCLFVISAVESLNDRVLAALDKGHTAADVPVALRAVRDAGMELRPTLLPFTPWTNLGDSARLCEFALEHGLDLDPVQLTLRLLIPPGSRVLEDPESPRGSAAGASSAPPRPSWLGELDAERFSYRWTHEDPRVDALCAESSALVAADTASGASPEDTLERLRVMAESAVGRTAREVPRQPRRKSPRLTEPWFC